MKATTKDIPVKLTVEMSMSEWIGLLELLSDSTNDSDVAYIATYAEARDLTPEQITKRADLLRNFLATISNVEPFKSS